MSDETTTAKNILSIPTKPASTKQPSELVAALKKGLSSADVFEAFEALDAFPPDTVRAALEPWTGPAPSTDALDTRLRAALGLPGKIPTFQCTGLRRPSRSDELSTLDQEQIRRAGKGWDDRDLDTAARLRGDGSESSFAGTLELISLSVASESTRYDVVRFRTDNGTVFHAGTSKVAGVLADGVVELSNHEDRVALQNVLASPLVVVKVATQTAKKAETAPKAPPPKVSASAGEGAKKSATEAAAAKAAPKKGTESKTAPKPKTLAKATPKKAAAKSTAAKVTATAKATAKKKATAKAAPAKATSKKEASKSVATKKAVAKGNAAKKPTSKKAAAEKTASAKKANSKAATAKKATTKKPAKKVVAAPKKAASAKKSVSTKKAAKSGASAKAPRAKAAAKSSASKRAKAPAKKPAVKAVKAKGGAAKSASKKPAARRSPTRK